MKTALWIGLGIVIVVALVLAGLGAGWALWGRALWSAGSFVMSGTAAGPGPSGACDGREGSVGRGMMDGSTVTAEPCAGWGQATNPRITDDTTDTLTIEEAHEAVEQYVARLDYPDLEIAEVIEFERNFYAIVAETDTGIGAMELLVDKWTGGVGPEMGPNMMWNGRYGMHGRGIGMMGNASETNVISADEALEIAQRWLNTYRPGVIGEEHADPFYGYYTIHTMKDSQIEGMLSVHGTTGQVWYHTWHGDFVQMVEHNDSH